MYEQQNDEEEAKETRTVYKAAAVVLLFACGIGLVTALLANHDKDTAPGVINPNTHLKNPTTDRGSPIGWIAVFGSIVVFGSYGIMMKAPEVKSKKVDTMVFQCYSSIGIAGVSLLVLTYVPWKFSWWGIAGAGMLVLIQVFAFNAISALGYAVGPAIWAGITIVVSFLWGSLKFGEQVESVPGAVCSLLLMIIGIAGIASCETGLPLRLAAMLGCGSADENANYEGMPAEEDKEGGEEEGPKVGKAMGGVFCVVVGLLNGSLMVPFKYLADDLPANDPPIAYLGSFAVGVLVTTPIFFVFYFYFPIRKAPEWHFRSAFIPGVVTGALWGIGNICATYATQYLGDTVGFPLTQTCIIFNGLWGILFYGEIKGKAKIGMFALCCVIIVGASTLLTIAKGS